MSTKRKAVADRVLIVLHFISNSRLALMWSEVADATEHYTQAMYALSIALPTNLKKASCPALWL